MKEIEALVHRGRAADVVHALVDAQYTRLSLTDVKGTLEGLTNAEIDYSVEFGESVINEVKVEIVCETGRIEGALEILRNFGHSSRSSGWAYVIDVEQAVKLDS